MSLDKVLRGSEARKNFSKIGLKSHEVGDIVLSPKEPPVL